MKKILHLNLKGEYFDQIKSGEKKWEYRLCNEYWQKRLLHRYYDGIILMKGYPKKNDQSKRLPREWKGWELQKIIHPHFGPKSVTVFAIRVNP